MAGQLLDVRWQYTTGNSVNKVSVLRGLSRVVLSADQDFLCIGTDGKVIWKYSTQGYVSDFVYSQDSSLVHFSSGDMILCMNLDGKVVWKKQVGGLIEHIVDVPGKKSTLICADKTCYCFDREGGSLWDRSFEEAIKYAGAFGDFAFVCLKNGIVHCIDSSGKDAWTYALAGKISDAVVYGDGKGVFFGNERNLVALKSDGKLGWKVALEDSIKKIASDDATAKVYVGLANGMVYISHHSGEMIKKFALEGGIEKLETSKSTSGFALVTASNELMLFNAAGARIGSFQAKDYVNSVDYLEGEDSVVAGSMDTNVYCVSSVTAKKSAPEPRKPLVPPPKPKMPEPEKKAIIVKYNLPAKKEAEIQKDLVSYIVTEHHMIFTETELANVYYCLKTQPFLIICGSPGMGKTKLAMHLCGAFRNKIFGKDLVRDVFISIHHDFDETDLWGYVNLADEYIPSALAKTLFYEGERLRGIEEIKNDDRLYFLILDELNLSQPDFYMTKLLAAIESGQPIQLPTGKGQMEVIHRPLPKNTFVIGTINSYVNEPTREKLSGGLKRRANIIFTKNPLDIVLKMKKDDAYAEFRRMMEVMIAQIAQDNIKESLVGGFRAEDLKAISSENREAVFSTLFELVMVLNANDETKMSLGVIQDMLEYMLFSRSINVKERLDNQIQQKIISMISGNVEIVDRILKIPGFETDYPASTGLLSKIQKEARGNMNVIISPV